MNTTGTDHTSASSRTRGQHKLHHSVVRVIAAGAVGLSALSIAMAAPSAAKGPHPGPVIDRPEPTSSLSAQNNDGRISTAPVSPAQRMAPGAIPRSQPATSISAQQTAGGTPQSSTNRAESPAPRPDPASGARDTAHRAEPRTPSMPSGMTPADAVRSSGGMGAAT